MSKEVKDKHVKGPSDGGLPPSVVWYDCKHCANYWLNDSEHQTCEGVEKASGHDFMKCFKKLD